MDTLKYTLNPYNKLNLQHLLMYSFEEVVGYIQFVTPIILLWITYAVLINDLRVTNSLSAGITCLIIITALVYK